MIKSKASLTLVFLIFASFAIGQDYKIGNPATIFSGHEIVEISIIADFQTILKDVGDERTEHPGLLTYIAGKDTLSLDVQLMTRGNFRRSPANCSFPPLRINFKKKQVRNTLFENMDKVKLVTHCKPKAKTYKNYILEEYLIYRVYNILTDTSFRVRPLLVKYVDYPSGKRTEESFAFIIEPDDALAKRLNLKESKQKYLIQDSTQFEHVSRMAIFQYMVGNTDFAVTTLHNIKLFKSDSASKPYAIPYDFDWCGAISAKYARPLPKFEIESVRERLFRGYCRSIEEFKLSFDYFKEKREEIYSLYQNFEQLDDRRRNQVLKYYDDFYLVIENDRRIEIDFLGKCMK